MQDGIFDEALTQIAGRAGSLDALLHHFFGFLNRRTDLYVTITKEQKDANMGFPEGIAEQLVLRSMRKYPYSPYNSGSSSGSGSGTNTGTKSGSISESDSKTAKIASSSPSSTSWSSSCIIMNISHHPGGHPKSQKC